MTGGNRDEEDLSDRSGLRKLRTEDGGGRESGGRRCGGNRELYDPEDEGGLCGGSGCGCRHAERPESLQKGGERL